MICLCCGERGRHIQPETHDAECAAKHPELLPAGVDWRAIALALYREYAETSSDLADGDVTPLAYLMRRHPLR